jgi:mannitol-1-/sugar-/sorbitol-6-/2-deoxyglucose-6-phosphatase
MKLRAAIYDMDGLLLDSEPYWVEAEAEVLGDVGVPMTPELARETTGMRLDEVVAHWFRRFPWKGQSQGDVLARLTRAAHTLILAKAQAKPGVRESLLFFARHGIRRALASSSPVVLINGVVEKLGLSEHFELTVSAEAEAYGKPHPAVYLTCAKRLALAPTACVALEDSVNGLVSAKAARMRVIAVPEAAQRADPRFSLADAVLGSLADIDEQLWKRLQPAG